MAIPYKKISILKPSKSKVTINHWRGLNYSDSIADSELAEMKNMVSDGGVLSVRPPREIIASGIEQPQKILFCGDKLSYIAGGKLYIKNDTSFDCAGEVGIPTAAVDFNNRKMLFYPTDMVYDYEKNTVEQTMETMQKNDCPDMLAFCNDDIYCYGMLLTEKGSNDNEFITLQPIKDSTGKTVKDENGCDMYPVISVHCSADKYFYNGNTRYRRRLYVRAWGKDSDGNEVLLTRASGYRNYHEEYEFGEKIAFDNDYAVKLKIISGYCYDYGKYPTYVDDICLEAKNDDYNNGIETEETIKYWVSPSTYPAPNSRPPIKYACLDNNRVVGVEGNNFYVSSLGDYTDWTDFVDSEGNPKATGAYAEELYSYGNFTGITKFRSNVILTKRNSFYECYGNKPPYRISLASSIGCIDNRSISEVGGNLYFLGAEGVFRYSGGMPINISEKLTGGIGRFISGCGAGDGTKYYLYAIGERQSCLLMYDTVNGFWCREDNEEIVDMVSFDKTVYAITARGEILKFDSGEEGIEWEFKTKTFDLNSYVKKIPKRLIVEATADLDATMNIYIRYDNGEFIPVATYSGFKTDIADIRLKNKVCNSFQLKLCGRGNVKILSLCCELISSSKGHNKAYLIKY